MDIRKLIIFGKSHWLNIIMYMTYWKCGKGSRLLFSRFGNDPLEGVKLFSIFLTAVVSMLGLISNTMVVMVNRRIKKPTSTDIYISFISITDNLMIVFTSFLFYGYIFVCTYIYTDCFTSIILQGYRIWIEFDIVDSKDNT
jgi:hypothetical protein